MNEQNATENGDERRRTSIRRVRLDLDITQAAMAARMGISRARYSELENGRGITANFARLIAKQTGQTVGEVWDEYDSISGKVAS